ncbi:nonribosomal peptide synthetase [Dothideomycetidae sp. 11243]|nr:nonribosomal peptide synthetase [fungal sp. No.11243]
MAAQLQEQESGQPLSILNPFPKPIPGPSLLHDLIADSSTKATALECYDHNGIVLELSYQQLHDRSSALADILSIQRNSSTARIIPLLVPQCAALYISQIAILKAGAAFCPLTLDVPEERLKFILSDISASLVVTVPELQHKFDCIPNLRLIILDVKGDLQKISSADVVDEAPKNVHMSPRFPCDPGDPAYIMYTSGSTGTPKAVSISHRAVTQSLLAHHRFIPEFARFLQFANPTFDVSVFEIFFPLFRKSTLISCERTYLLSDLPSVIDTLDVDGAEFTPSVVASLIRSRGNVPKLRTLLTIGEMLNPQTVREFAGENTEDSILFGMYGPTEAAIHCTLQPNFRNSDTINTIGVPLDTVSCFIVRPADEESSPDKFTILPVGEVGELAVGGLQLADGYLNRSEQTQAAFVNHQTYGRLYRTGDKAKLTANGTLLCFGRISKGQVKLRGQRIELGEIEHAASRLEGVHAASASVVDGQLVIFCVADPSSVTQTAVQASCRRWLPRFMVPNEIVILRDFPYLPSGKIDQKKLESDHRGRCEKDSKSDGAADVLDQKLFNLVRSSIGKQLTSTSRLTTSGLDSLRAIKLATEMRRQGYPQLSAVDILLSSTYKDIEQITIGFKKRPKVADDPQISTWQRELKENVQETLRNRSSQPIDSFPCTPIQDAMLVETTRNTKAYINSVKVALPPAANFEQTRKAIHTVASRHSALRTGFLPSGHTTCAFAQVEWQDILDDQINTTEDSEPELVVDDIDTFLLRPLRVFFTKASGRPEVCFYMHHGLYDQWSLDILVDDLYKALNGMQELACSSFGNVAWQLLLETYSEELRSRSEDFWKSYLTGCKATKLPSLTTRVFQRESQVQTFVVTSRPADIATIASQMSVSESALFQTLFGHIIGLYAGQTEITFGSVFSGRTAAIEDVQDVFGPMLATLPVRLSTDGVRRFQDAAQAMHSSNRSIMAHSSTSLVAIKKAADIDPSNALFDSIFVWQSSSRERIEQDSVVLVGTTDSVEFDLVLEVEPKSENYLMKATYNSNKLPEAQVRFFLDQIDHALKSVIKNSDAQLSTLFSDATSEKLMSISNPHPRTLSCDGGLPALLEDRFRQHADDPALLFTNGMSGSEGEQTVLTYFELDRRANQLAHCLISNGLQPGGLVLVMLEKSIDLYVSILAVIKASCGYLPILPTTPTQRIRKAVIDSAIVFALADEATKDILETMSIPNVFTVADLELSSWSSCNPDIKAKNADIAYAIWTSGTTGTPKAVLISQENIVGNLKALGDIYPVEPSSRLLQSCNQAFDVSVFEIFFAWYRGMCLCSTTNDILYRDIEHSIRTLQITHLSMTPTVASLVDPGKVPSVRFLVTAGEALTKQVQRRWAGRGLWQGYGPSETTNICSVKPNVDEDDAINNVGPPLSNTTALVLSKASNFDLLPRGALGELCFSGQQVFPGYQNQPQLTTNKILVHPRYGRVYRSGDLGRLAWNGDILIEGRTDSQRKIRGQRIELSEITSSILQCEGVVDASVVITGLHGRERLIAFFVPSSSQSNHYRILEIDSMLLRTIADIRHTIVDCLPAYMVPSSFIPVAAFSMTGQAKINTSQMLSDADDLPSSYHLEADDQDEGGKLSPTEILICGAICETLGISEAHFSRNTSTIQAGLDSVSAIKLASKLRSLTNVQIDVSAILKRSKLSDLASYIDSRGESAGVSKTSVPVSMSFLSAEKLADVEKTCKVQNLSVESILPCTPLQEAMLSASVGSAASAYLNRTVFKVWIDLEQMKSHWRTLLQRHQILRTVFVSTQDGQFPFVQVVLNDADLPWTVSEDVADAQTLLHKEEQQFAPPLDSLQMPYRLRCHRSADGVYLVVDMHHSLYDANAMSNLQQEVEMLQNNESLPEATQFGKFLDFMLQTRNSDAERFFDDMLQDLKPNVLLDRDQQNANVHAYSLSIPIDPAETREFCHEHEVSLLSTCQAAWSKVLCTLLHTSDVCFGNIISGRSVPVEDVDRLVAPCFNTLPVRANLDCKGTWLDLVQHFHQINVEALPYQLYPLRRIQQRLECGQRLFDSLILLQEPEKPLDSRIWTLVGEKGDMDFPCIIELKPQADCMKLSLHYVEGLFKQESQVALLSELFVDAFAHLLRYPLSRISDMALPERYSSVSGIFEKEAPEIPPGSNSADSAAWSTTEMQIRDVFLSLSPKIPKMVTSKTTIYRLGLDSISAIQAAKALRDSGIVVTAAEILQHPSPADLARFWNDSATNSKETNHGTDSFDFEAFDERTREAIAQQCGLDKSNIEAVRPCTAVQAAMLSASEQSAGQNYLNHFSHRVAFRVTPDQLQRAWTFVVQRHAILRTAFVSIDNPQFSFAMVTFKYLPFEPVQFLENASTRNSAMEQLDRQNTKSILAHPQSPPWRCHIMEDQAELQLRLSMHHAIYDAESISQILDDLQRLATGESPESTQPIDRALDHILSQNAPSQSQQDFWTSKLNTANPTHFPNLHPVNISASEVLDVSLMSSLRRSKFEELCSARDISPQALFQVAWARLLASYTGEEEVTFGVVVSGRSATETENVCFPCINTLPLACNTAIDSLELMRDLTSFNAASQDYTFTPLSSIHRWLGQPQETLFNTILAFQKPMHSAQSDPKWHITYERASVNYAVSIEIEHLPDDQLRLRSTFEASVLPKAQAEKMLQQLDAITLQLLDQDPCINRSSDVLSVLHPKDSVIETDMTQLLDMFDRAVLQHPNKLAMEFVFDRDRQSTKTWTYSELDAIGNQVANLLRLRGVKSGDRVGVCCEKCPQASFAFVGILKAGGAILAIDPTAPLARKEFVLSDAEVSVVLASTKVATELANGKAPRILDLEQELTDDLPKSPPQSLGLLPGTSISYVLYTSGTTGTPKGCELTNENAVQALLAFQRLFKGRWTKDSVWCQFASYHFDVAILEHFWTWSVGIKLLCAPRDLILEDLAGFIDDHKVTHIDLTPSLGRLLDPQLVPSLHSGVFITGGEAVKPEMLKAWGPTGCLFNFYGPTECTIGVTTFPSVPGNGKASNIGWQFDNVGTCVLKPGTQSPVIRGGIGELCIFGKLVGKGYLNRPDLTEAQFPYMRSIGERIYRTGDLVRILHDDSIEFLGRADSQVKLRGQRLEIDEIVAVMRESAVVKDAVCLVARQNDKQKEQLIAFISSSTTRRQTQPILEVNQNTIKTTSQARSACEQKLPGYMVPTHFIPVEFIPLSVNNKQYDKALKLLYEALSTAQLQQLSISGGDDRDLDETECSIVQILSETLGTHLEDVLPSSNIFSLGLSSISAVQYSRRLKSAGYEEFSVSTVMQNGTIGKLARALQPTMRASEEYHEVLYAKQTIQACQQKYLSSAVRNLGCKTSDVQRIAPCTPLQQGMLYRSLSSKDGLYFNRFRFDIGGQDLIKLRKAFNELVQTTDILRTSFLDTDDGHVQVVRKNVELDWQIVTEADDEMVESSLDQSHRQWMSANDPELVQPFAVRVAKSRNRQICQICVHHTLYDGIAWSLIMQKLHDILDGRPFDGEKISFFDVLASGPLRQDRGRQEFWAKQMQGVACDRMHQLAEAKSPQDPLISDKLYLPEIDVARRELQVTTQSIIQAAWSVTLANYHLGPMGLIVAGRAFDLDAENVIGPLFNTIPFPWQLKENETWADLAKRCHDFNTASLPYHHTPSRDISKWLRKAADEPLFDTLFVFQQPDTHQHSARNLLRPIEDETYIADYPLSFEIEDNLDATLTVTLGAQQRICDRETLTEMFERFKNNIEALIREPSQKPQIPAYYMSRKQERTGQKDLPDLNGYHGHFEWTADAEAIRSELADLAKIDVEDIDEHTSMFSIGLDSIDAVKLSSRLKKHHISIPVSTLMQSQTIPKIVGRANKTTSDRRTEDASNQEQTRREALERCVLTSLSSESNVEQILPATPMQEGLVSEMIQSNFQSYFNHDVLELRTDVDTDRLKSAWRTVIQASPILRTAFVEVEDPSVENTFAQVILKNQDDCITQIVDSDVGIDCLIADITAEMVEDSSLRSPFRVTFLTQGEKRFLALSIAHALYDGFSLGLLHKDVHKAYEQTFLPRPSYAPFASQAVSAIGPAATSFWQATMARVESSLFPYNGNSKDTRTHRCERTSKMSTSQIRSVCQRMGVTLQALCQTAWALSLAERSKTLNVAYGLVLAGRDSAMSQEILFPTMNTVVFRTSLHGTGRDVVKDTQATLLEMLPYQQTPLRHIQRIAKQESDHLSGPLFNTLFTYQKSTVDGPVASEPLYTSIRGLSDVEYPVAIESELVNEKLIWRIAVKSSALGPEETERLLQETDVYLAHLVEDPEKNLLEFSTGTVSIFDGRSFELRSTDASTKNVKMSNTSAGRMSPLEKKIAELVAQIAEVTLSEVAKNTRLENLGIDSISAIKLSSTLRKQGIVLPVSKLLLVGTIENMAQSVENDSADTSIGGSSPDHAAIFMERKQAEIETLDLDMTSIERILPATAGQTYMLGSWLNSKGRLFYPTSTYAVSGNEDISALKSAWVSLVERHPILRTTFVATHDEEMPFVQVVHKHDQSADGNDHQQFAQCEVTRNDDLIILKISIHHALYDAVSLDLLVRDLATLAGGHAISHPLVDFGSLLNLSLSDDARANQRRFWTDYLRDIRVPDDAAPYGGSRIETFKPDLLKVNNYATSRLRELGISMQALFFAVYAQIYAASTTTQSDVVFGIYLANRSHLEEHAVLAAPTVNLVPLRAKVGEDIDVEDVARQVQRDVQLISKADISATSLWDIQRWTGVTVHSFVNFIKLPDASDRDGSKEGAVKIENLDDEREFLKRAEVHEEQPRTFNIPDELRGSLAQSAYPPTLDVEATVRDGVLAMGVFGYESKVTLGHAEDIVSGVKKRLEDFFN